MSMLRVDSTSNPFGQTAAAQCRRCGWAIAGLVLASDGSGEFEHRDTAGCEEARQLIEELGEDLLR